jgi:hypothetical protein
MSFSITLLHGVSQSQSQNYFTTGGLPPFSSSWREPLETHDQHLFIQLNTCFHSPYVTSSLTRGWVRSLQLLLALASTVILRSDSRRIGDHISLSRIRDSPNLEGHVLVFISPRKRVTQLYPQALRSLLIVSYDW